MASSLHFHLTMRRLIAAAILTFAIQPIPLFAASATSAAQKDGPGPLEPAVTGAPAVGRPSDGSSEYISLYFFSPPGKLNWHSPGALARSIFYNQIFPSRAIDIDPQTHALKMARHIIGHAEALIHCRIHGRDHEIYTGQTSTDGANRRESSEFLHLHGTEMIFEDVNGRENTPDEIRGDLNQYQTDGRLKVLTLKLSEENCALVLDFHRRYIQYGMQNRFGGLNSNPLCKASGCTAYALMLAKSAGALTRHMKDSMSRSVCFPDSLIGSGGKTSTASILSLALGIKEGHFASPDSAEPKLCISIPDPEKAADYVVSLYKGQATVDLPIVERRKTGRSDVVVLDARHQPTELRTNVMLRNSNIPPDPRLSTQVVKSFSSAVTGNDCPTNAELQASPRPYAYPNDSMSSHVRFGGLY